MLAGRELSISRPDDPESLIDESRFDEDEYLPYWTELWPGGIALAQHVAEVQIDGARVLELGCGLALSSFAAALAGARVLATDWAPECLDLVERNAATTGLAVGVAALDRIAPRSPGSKGYDLGVAADVLYEERNAEPLARMLGETVSPGGADRGSWPAARGGTRRHAAAFFGRVRAEGWSVERTRVAALPAGGILRLWRQTRKTG